MGKNYSGLLNSIYLFGNACRSFNWSRPSLVKHKADSKTTADAAASGIATDAFPVSSGKAILFSETNQSVSSILNNKSRFNTNFQNTVFAAVLLFVINTVGVSAKNVHMAKTISSSNTALAKNSTFQSLSESTFSNTKSIHFYTYIYVPILQIQNKGDCRKEDPLIKPLIRCNSKINFISQNHTVPNPNKNNTNLIPNT